MKESIRRAMKECIEANVDGQPLVTYLTGLMNDLDKAEVNVARASLKVAAAKQICNYYRNVNLSYKYQLMESGRL